MRLSSFIVLVLMLSISMVARGDAKDKGADNLDGTWLPATAEFGGKPWPEEVRKITKLVIHDNQYTVTVGDAPPDKGNLKLDPSANPKAIDVTGTEGPNKGKTFPAIYERDGDTLRICYDLSGQARPAAFQTTEGTKLFLVKYDLAKS